MKLPKIANIYKKRKITIKTLYILGNNSIVINNKFFKPLNWLNILTILNILKLSKNWIKPSDYYKKP